MEILYIAYILLFSFLFLAVYVYNGFKLELKKQPLYKSNLKLSIIVAAKNEENNITALLYSLGNLNYPKENYEVIFVDDSSTDKTYSTIQSLISGKDNYQLFRADQKRLEGKKGALTIGIENAKYNFIVITDADCKPEVNWLKSIASKLDAGYDFVFGVAPIESGKKLIEKLSAFENFRNTFLTISAVGLNVPYSASARSFAFRKSSFERTGGYSNTTETISGDDDLLIREAVKNKMLIGTLIDPEAFVYSEAPKAFDEYLKQKKRHLQTSYHYLPKQKMFLGFWHFINLISLFTVFLTLISPIFMLPFAVKLIYDFFITTKFQQVLGHSFKLYEIIYLQILFEIFIVINFFNSLSGKPEWK
jgi:cellulose synthase/poly-beta-1,6-N-acetylglucosamine synthase-like glycosyltransferase